MKFYCKFKIKLKLKVQGFNFQVLFKKTVISILTLAISMFYPLCKWAFYFKYQSEIFRQLLTFFQLLFILDTRAGHRTLYRSTLRFTVEVG